MFNLKSIFSIFLIIATMTFTSRVEAECAYVTDSGGFAYDECRAAVNLAPAIALGTVVIVAIIALAVQNSHDHSSSSSCCHNDCGCDFFSSSSSGSSSSGSNHCSNNCN